jgi:23S rRNA pseudouridine1911/1915/1917 synthase
MASNIQLQFTIPDTLRGQRLDVALATLVPDYSRARLQQWIRAGQVTLDTRIAQVREKVSGGEQVRIDAELQEQTRSAPEPIELDIVHADADLIVLNKPAGLVVHPAAGNPAGTLLNALLHFDAGLSAVPRAGIVHRLDKSTSGLLVVARNLATHHYLVDALQQRLIRREYLAVVNGVLTAGGSVEVPIGRHPVDRKRMAVTPGGKEALTHYRVVERFRAHTLVRVQLESGRTHQIRVHMAHIHHPVTGDPVYGGRLRLPAGAGAELQAVLSAFRRQALHATRLELVHPATGEPVQWQAEMPADMQQLVAALRTDAEGLPDGA